MEKHIVLVTQTMKAPNDTYGNPRLVTLVIVSNELDQHSIRECHDYLDSHTVKQNIIANIVNEFEKNGVAVTYTRIDMTTVDITGREYQYQKNRAGYNSFFAK